MDVVANDTDLLQQRSFLLRGGIFSGFLCLFEIGFLLQRLASILFGLFSLAVLPSTRAAAAHAFFFEPISF